MRKNNQSKKESWKRNFCLIKRVDFFSAIAKGCLSQDVQIFRFGSIWVELFLTKKEMNLFEKSFSIAQVSIF